MNRIGLLVFALLLSAFGPAFAAQKETATTWDDEASRAARAVVEQGLASVERLDAEALRAMCTADLVAYDIDLESKPVRMGSLSDAVGYVAAMGAEAKKMNAKVKFENVTYNCHATSDLAYCLLEYDFVATMGDGTRMVQPSQTTVVLSKSDGAWKWAHWHTSLSGAPSAGTE
jgi:ketosteroid isomerase-like protein